MFYNWLLDSVSVPEVSHLAMKVTPTNLKSQKVVGILEFASGWGAGS